MARVKPGQIRASVEDWKDVLLHFPVNANISSDGGQYSPVATVGTTPVYVASELFDPGVTVALKEASVGLTAMFTGLNGSMAGSINYYWEARTEAVVIGSGNSPVRLDGAWVNLSGTLSKSVPTLSTSEDTYSGQLKLGSLPYAPIRIRLTAVDTARASCETGKVKCSSIVQFVGNVLPGV
jgi:hypothetical protein